MGKEFIIIKRILLIEENGVPGSRGRLFLSIKDAVAFILKETFISKSYLASKINICLITGNPFKGYFFDEALTDESDKAETDELARKIFERRKEAGFPYRNKKVQEFVRQVQRIL